MSTPLLDTELLRRIGRLRLVARRPFRGAGAGERRARTHGASTDFRDHRPYAHGDDVRHLDWTLLARLDRLYLKRHHDQQDVTVHLVLDASQSMAFGEPPKVDAARRLLAALGHLALSGQDRVLAHQLGGRGQPPSALSGRGAVRQLLGWLSAVQAGGGLDLGEALEAVARRARRPGLVVLASDLLSDGVARGLEVLGAGRHQVDVLQVLAGDELAPTLDGDLRLRDCETGREVDVSLSPALRRLYVETLEAHEREVELLCRRIGATLTRIRSDEPVEAVVAGRLQQQGVVA